MNTATARRRQSARGRSARRRQRQRQGVRLYRLELEDRTTEALINGLVGSGRLREREACNRAAIEKALADLIADFAQRWRHV